MRLSDKLKEARATLFDRLEGLSKKAADEDRLFDAAESAEWDKAQGELKDLDKQIVRQEQAEQLQRAGQGQRVAVDDQGGRHLILRSADKIGRSYPPRHGQPLSLGRTIRGLVTGRWEDADMERRAMGEGGSGSAGGFLLTPELSATWWDLARAKSMAIAAGMGTIDMATQVLKIATIEEDVVPVFRPEHVALPEDDVVFGSAELRARLVGVLARASLELIMDAANATDMIETSLANAMAQAMDKAAIAGDGLVDATHDNPLGVLNWPAINEIPAAGAPSNYDAWLDAIAMIEAANLSPNATINNPATINALRKLKTGLAGDGTTLLPPPIYLDMDHVVSTGMPAGNSLTGQFDQALIGARMPITIEMTRSGGDNTFRQVQVLFRAVARMDVVVVRPKAFTKLTGITTAPLSRQPQAQAPQRAPAK